MCRRIRAFARGLCSKLQLVLEKIGIIMLNCACRVCYVFYALRLVNIGYITREYVAKHKRHEHLLKVGPKSFPNKAITRFPEVSWIEAL